MPTADIRLLQVIAGAEHGGAEKFFSRLAVAFAKHAIPQMVVMRAFDEPVALLKKNQIPVITAPFKRILDFKSKRLIKQAIEDFKPTLIMTWMSRASDLLPAGTTVPVIARLGGYYDLKYYQKADYLVGNTQDIVKYFHHHGWPAERTAYLPNFPDLPASCPPAARSQFDTPQSAPLLLSLGRLHTDKAFDVLIEALARIPAVYLWLGGEGPEESNLKSLASRMGVTNRIRFLGWHSNTSALYQACDIYICPSRIEPLGNVVLEAWAHHKPTVAARSAGPASLINHGTNGLLADIDDADGLTRALEMLIGDQTLCSRIAQGGYETLQENFTENVVVEAYLKFFNKIMTDYKGKH